MAQIKKKLEQDVNTLRKEVEDLELTVQKVRFSIKLIFLKLISYLKKTVTDFNSLLQYI